MELVSVDSEGRYDVVAVISVADAEFVRLRFETHPGVILKGMCFIADDPCVARGQEQRCQYDGNEVFHRFCLFVASRDKMLHDLNGIGGGTFA